MTCERRSRFSGWMTRLGIGLAIALVLACRVRRRGVESTGPTPSLHLARYASRLTTPPMGWIHQSA